MLLCAFVNERGLHIDETLNQAQSFTQHHLGRPDPFLTCFPIRLATEIELCNVESVLVLLISLEIVFVCEGLKSTAGLRAASRAAIGEVMR